MERVTGIGGFFFPARSPEELSRWYADHLGIDVPPADYETSSWRQQAGPTVFAPMATASPSLARTAGRWTLNLRVVRLDAMVEQLRRAGVSVEVDPETYPNGRFASLTDPEGNGIQLWQPDGADG
jgi:glyoxylase I family protein